LPAPGSVLKEHQLPATLQEQVTRLRSQYVQASYEPYRGGVRFEDASVWFANGYEVQIGAADILADAVPNLGIFGLLSAGAYTYYLFDVGSQARWIGAGATLLVLIITAAAIGWHRSRASRAVAQMKLGTLLLENCLVLISHGRYVVIERSAALRYEVVRVGTSNAPEIGSIRYRTSKGEAIQHLTGFAGNPEAIAELQRWIAQE
jgi:hypothetical protein